MVGNLDFGGEEVGSLDADQFPPTSLKMTVNGIPVTFHLLFGDVIRCGRNSELDICLRIQPTSDSENARQTGMISREHFRLMSVGDKIAIEDIGSTHGTTLDETPLPPKSSVDVSSGNTICVGGVLKLSVESFLSGNNPESIGCILISRVNNTPDQKYLWIIQDASIGTGENDAIQLSPRRSTASFALDFGGETPKDCGVSLRRDNAQNLVMECAGEEVGLNSQPITEGETRSLVAGDRLSVRGAIFNLE